MRLTGQLLQKNRRPRNETQLWNWSRYTDHLFDMRTVHTTLRHDGVGKHYYYQML